MFMATASGAACDSDLPQVPERGHGPMELGHAGALCVRLHGAAHCLPLQLVERGRVAPLLPQVSVFVRLY